MAPAVGRRWWAALLGLSSGDCESPATVLLATEATLPFSSRFAASSTPGAASFAVQEQEGPRWSGVPRRRGVH